jgi:signal transduction histidine kinase
LKAGFDLLLGEPSSSFTQTQHAHLLAMLGLCDDLLRLTRSYLDYAGIVHGSKPLCLGSFTIGALIQETRRQFIPVARSRRIELDCQVEHPETVVVTDASLCQQIFGNLVANSLKYTAAGGSVRVVGLTQSHSWCVVVSDSGPGIPAEAQELVFEPFYRLGRDEHSGIEGNGLGLAICRELVTQLDGSIALSSVIGQGTAVTVRFPLHARGEADQRGGVSAPATQGPSSHRRSAPIEAAPGSRYGDPAPRRTADANDPHPFRGRERTTRRRPTLERLPAQECAQPAVCDASESLGRLEES